MSFIAAMVMHTKMTSAGLIFSQLNSYRFHLDWVNRVFTFSLVQQLLSLQVEIEKSPSQLLPFHDTSNHIIINETEIVKDRAVIVDHRRRDNISIQDLT
jgi:hypothetical protein